MSLKISAVLLLAMVCTAYTRFVCQKDYCQRVNCSNALDRNQCEQNQNGIFEEHGTWCGCCPACLTKINEGESCWFTRLIGAPPKAKCAAGLTCDPKTVKCVPIE